MKKGRVSKRAPFFAVLKDRIHAAFRVVLNVFRIDPGLGQFRRSSLLLILARTAAHPPVKTDRQAAHSGRRSVGKRNKQLNKPQDILNLPRT